MCGVFGWCEWVCIVVEGVVGCWCASVCFLISGCCFLAVLSDCVVCNYVCLCYRGVSCWSFCVQRFLFFPFVLEVSYYIAHGTPCTEFCNHMLYITTLC